MRAWIVNPYGTLPSEGWREYRSSMLARALSAKGHQVTWFLSNFEHRSKTFRRDVRNDPLLPGVEIRCLPSKPYSRNISLARVRYERSFGRAFAAASEELAKPDCIVLAEPSVFFGDPVREFARRANLPLVVDILDLWPEMFDLALPRPIRPLGRMLFSPLYARRRRLMREAAAVVACTSEYAAIAKAVTGAPVRTFYLGVDVKDVRRTPAPESVPALPPLEPLTCVYAGTLGDAYDIPCLLDAVQRLAEPGNVRLIVAGAGPAAEAFRQVSATHPGTLDFLGEVAPDQLSAIYSQAQIGLCTYAAGSTVSMPVKLFDYLAAGLGVVTSLEGEIGEIIASGAGTFYPAGDSERLAEVLNELANAPDRVREMQSVAYATGERFDQHTQHEAFARFIEEVVETENARPG